MNSRRVHFTLILAMCSVAGVPLVAQSCGFSSGKSLYELKVAVAEKQDLLQGKTACFPVQNSALQTRPLPASRIFLPQWSADELPFFCRIEHNLAKGRNRTPVKFRLGSVEYVDWLEGKSFDKTRF